jgi:hypothetical protein
VTTGSLEFNRLTRSYMQMSAQGHATYRRDAYIHERVPPLPKVTFGNDAHCISELCLDGSWDGDHQTDQLLLDQVHFLQRQFIISLDILLPVQRPIIESVMERRAAHSPIALHKILEK